jgi:hypothetical protein
MKQFFGKYRGKVENNIDPMQQGRVQVSVPAVLGEGTLSWAMPSVPYAGNGVGFFVIPPEGANVWAEFEGGDPDYPIWSGCFWGQGEVPVQPAIAEVKMLKTDGITLTLSDASSGGGVTLEVDSPAVTTPLKMIFDSNGIEINNDPAIVRLTQSEIEMSFEPVKVTITKEDVQIANDPVIAKVTGEEIELTNDAVSTKIASDQIELKNDSVSVKVTSDSIDMENGSSKVSLSSSSVDINDGALEVM